MFSKYSDLEERLPAYERMMGAVQANAAEGAFEGIDPELLRLLKGAVPVGLDARRRVVVPADFDPLRGPAILVAAPSDKKDFGTKDIARFTELAVAASLGINFAKNAIPRRASPKAKTAAMMLFHAAEIQQSYNYNGPAQFINVPEVIVLGSESHDEYWDAYRLTHELRHYQGLLDPASRYDRSLNPLQWRASAEKAAYANPSRLFISNVGLTEDMPSPEALVQPNQHRIAEDVVEQIRRKLLVVFDEGDSRQHYLAPIAAAAITHAYGDPASPTTTSAEQMAFVRYGLIR